MTLESILKNIDAIIKKSPKKNECRLTSSLKRRMEIMNLIESAAPYFEKPNNKANSQIDNHR